MAETLNGQLRRRLTGGPEALVVPGAANALTAKLIQESGFEALYLSGAGVSNTYLGVPDLGLLTLSELAGHVGAIRDVVEVPLIVDADTGFGNSIAVQRTVRLLERAGANAIQIEDQVSPKRCGHFAGKMVVDAQEMVGKLRAAVDARVDDDLVVIARTDALAVKGLEDACERARLYLDAGADVAFIEAPRTVEQLALIPRKVPGLHVANMVEGGQTPVVALSDLTSMGFSLVLYANTALRASIVAMRQVLQHLRKVGDSTAMGEGIIASWDDRQSVVGFDKFADLERRYGSDQ